MISLGRLAKNQRGELSREEEVLWLAESALQAGELLPKGSRFMVEKRGVSLWITTEMALHRLDALNEDCKSQVWKPT